MGVLSGTLQQKVCRKLGEEIKRWNVSIIKQKLFREEKNQLTKI